ncbi:hypothetical protein KAT55_02680 [Candidatus Bathyarchaeota archaeon]|nr:hypothetical protein [Candidatus Bathyarchaeota archaeon]
MRKKWDPTFTTLGFLEVGHDLVPEEVYGLLLAWPQRRTRNEMGYTGLEQLFDLLHTLAGITAIQVDIRDIDLGAEHQDREEGVFGDESVSYEIFLLEIIGWKLGRVKLQPLGDVFIPFSVYPSE